MDNCQGQSLEILRMYTFTIHSLTTPYNFLPIILPLPMAVGGGGGGGGGGKPLIYSLPGVVSLHTTGQWVIRDCCLFVGWDDIHRYRRSTEK